MENFSRSALLKSKEYWLLNWQLKLYEEIEVYMETHQMTQTELAKLMGCSKSYVSQVLNGNFDHKISKLIEISLAIGKAPYLSFKMLEDVVLNDQYQQEHPTSLETPSYTFHFSDNAAIISSGISSQKKRKYFEYPEEEVAIEYQPDFF